MPLKTSAQAAFVGILLQTFIWISACATSPVAVTQSEQATDAAIVARVKAALLRDPYLYAAHIDVTANRGDVRLTGFVAEADDFAKAVHTAKGVAGVRHVINNLQLVDRR